MIKFCPICGTEFLAPHFGGVLSCSGNCAVELNRLLESSEPPDRAIYALRVSVAVALEMLDGGRAGASDVLRQGLAAATLQLRIASATSGRSDFICNGCSRSSAERCKPDCPSQVFPRR